MGSHSTQQNSEAIRWEKLKATYRQYSEQTFRDFHQTYIGKLKPPEKPTTYEELEACFRDFLRSR